MKKHNKLYLSVLTIIALSAIILSGCAHINNSNWSDLSQREQEQIKQELDKTISDLKNDFE